MYARAFPENVRALVLTTPQTPKSQHGLNMSIAWVEHSEILLQKKFNHVIAPSNDKYNLSYNEDYGTEIMNKFKDIIQYLLIEPTNDKYCNNNSNDECFSAENMKKLIRIFRSMIFILHREEPDNQLFTKKDMDAFTALLFKFKDQGASQINKVLDQEKFNSFNQLNPNQLNFVKWSDFYAVICADAPDLGAPDKNDMIKQLQNASKVFGTLHALDAQAEFDVGSPYHCYDWKTKRNPIPNIADMEDKDQLPKQILIAASDNSVTYQWAR